MSLVYQNFELCGSRGQTYRLHISNEDDSFSMVDHNLLIYCANLWVGNKLIDKDRFHDLLLQDKSIGLIIDPDKYDFLNFDIKCLKRLSEKSLETIMNNKNAYDKIHEAIKEQIISNKGNIDRELIYIYSKYFS